jgi:hypothetical protein
MPFYFGLKLISRADKFRFQSGDIMMMLDNIVGTQPPKVNIVRAEQNP